MSNREYTTLSLSTVSDWYVWAVMTLQLLQLRKEIIIQSHRCRSYHPHYLKRTVSIDIVQPLPVYEDSGASLRTFTHSCLMPQLYDASSLILYSRSISEVYSIEITLILHLWIIALVHSIERMIRRRHKYRVGKKLHSHKNLNNANCQIFWTLRDTLLIAPFPYLNTFDDGKCYVIASARSNLFRIFMYFSRSQCTAH